MILYYAESAVALWAELVDALLEGERYIAGGSGLSLIPKTGSLLFVSFFALKSYTKRKNFI
jgi:hypothetical protein